MSKICCGGTGFTVLTVASAAVAPHPMVADQPKCPAPPPDQLPAVSQVLFPTERKTAKFRWVKASTGQDCLEIEMNGLIRWIPVFTSKP